MKLTMQKDRIERHTSQRTLEKIHSTTLGNVRKFGAQSQMLESRIVQLKKEWDVERILETNASILALISVVLALFVNTNWIYLTVIVLAFLLLHNVQGWCPPLPLMRRLGKRTRHEMEEERHALKALRGDYQNITTPEEAYGAATKE